MGKPHDDPTAISDIIDNPALQLAFLGRAAITDA
jgi:hypothetical protein